MAATLVFTWSIGFAQGQEKSAAPMGSPARSITKTASSSDKVETLRVEAYRLYREKDYARACPKYEAAAQLAPDRGDLWADLGLCLFKSGNKEKAKEAEIKAIETGSKEVRLHAYYNLSKIGVNLAIPQAGCTEWPCSREGCSRPLTVCRYEEHCLSGTGLSMESSGLGFCPNASDAKVYQLSCNDNAASCFGIELESVERSYCRPGDVGKAPCGACGCEEALDPKACEAAVAQCMKTAVEEKKLDCAFVYADAERLRVGAICDGKAEELSNSR